ncbi:DUF4157 domain-containing protein [Rhodonellum sp.]|uniref:eCIS core domain-containing protein n=1 Tax=Rhodonellum sp. TaxID=2231180 RepID=UPI0027187149|nr:DUF4157 domain-containing protein [Rhodonellum sp.]MDO9554649.1 DUF4157 domain-containing protein [Rhodonellum sp.]
MKSKSIPSNKKTSSPSPSFSDKKNVPVSKPFKDMRSESNVLSGIGQMANMGAQSLQMKGFENLINANPLVQKARIQMEMEPLQGKFDTVQRMELEEEEPLQGMFDSAQRIELEEEEPLQGKFDTVQRMGLEEEEPLQGMFDTAQRIELEEEEPLQGMFDSAQRMEEEELQMKPISVQKKENKTGLPDNLKNGVENLSGHSLDDVNVHYNSSEPAEIQAHAYAKGTDIHLAPGQEKHLPHEAWHVVQQKQGRVKPTLQLKEGIHINDDAGLEKEADVMGAKSIQMKSEHLNTMETANKRGIKNIIVQRVKVGGDGAGIIFIAARYFNEAFKEAVVVLEQLKESGVDFDSVDKIVEKVHEDPTVANLMGAVNVKKELASAKSKEREASKVLMDYGHGVQVKEFDIENGTWQSIPGRENGDFELLVNIPSYDTTFSFHVHPPKFSGQRPIAGEIMRNGKMTKTQTPNDIIDFIMSKKQKPKSW